MFAYITCFILGHAFREAMVNEQATVICLGCGHIVYPKATVPPHRCGVGCVGTSHTYPERKRKARR